MNAPVCPVFEWEQWNCPRAAHCPNALNGGDDMGVEGCEYISPAYEDYDDLHEVTLRAMHSYLETVVTVGEAPPDSGLTVPIQLGRSVAQQLGIYADDRVLAWLGYQVYNQFADCFEYGTSPRFAWVSSDGPSAPRLMQLIEMSLGR